MYLRFFAKKKIPASNMLRKKMRRNVIYKLLIGPIHVRSQILFPATYFFPTNIGIKIATR